MTRIKAPFRHSPLWSGTAIAVTLFACGGSEFTAGGDTNGLDGTGNSSSGGSANGGSSSGGASTGGVVSTGGVSMGGASTGGVSMGGAGGSVVECRSDVDCPQLGAPCSSATCVDGFCQFSTIGCGGAGGSMGIACTEASECPAPPPSCSQCPDGNFVCLTVDCTNGECVLVTPPCPTTSDSCPVDVPLDGSACSAPPGSVIGEVAHCSWGDDPRVECRTTALCEENGVWVLTKPTQAYCNDDPLPASCPSSPPAGITTCTGTEPDCWYEDGTHCTCSDCVGVSVCQVVDPPQWSCHAPLAGCPDGTPQAGSPCDTQDLTCGPSCELLVICDEGSWRWRQGLCPVCAAPNTPIETPEGARPIAELREGDLVYSVHGGAVVPVPIARVGSTPVQNHRVMRVQLESGAVLEISPGHPTADGRTFGELHAGDLLDEQHGVASSTLVPFTHDRTYDILPASDTGTYFAAGALVGSTLLDRAVPIDGPRSTVRAR